jgi:hypothetical protein
MRTDWLPISASALVIGVMSLVLGSLLNPTVGSKDAAATLRVVEQSDGRWFGMAVMYFIASIALSLGLPALLSLFTTRGHRLGLLAVGVFAVGSIGLSGYAMLMVFFRALVVKDALKASGQGLDAVTHEAGLTVFLYGWLAAFYLGVALVGVALLVARRTPRWVPFTFFFFLVLAPISPSLGRVGAAVQIMALAVAFTGVAVAAVSAEHERSLADQPVF